MRAISTAELAVLVKELQEFDEFYIERFYEVAEGAFRLKLKKDKAQQNVQIILSRTINKTRYIEKQEQPSNFAMAVRKRVEGFKIRGIRQLNNDRIVVFELAKGTDQMNLIVEMFGVGNLIITNKEMSILLAYVQRQFKDRAISPGVTYTPPRQSTGYKAVSLEEVDRHGFATLSEALDQYYYENPIEKKEVKNEAAEQLKISIEKQRKILSQIDDDIRANKEVGERIMNNMQKVNQIIDELKKNKRANIEDVKPGAGIKVLGLSLKDKTVTLEID